MTIVDDVRALEESRISAMLKGDVEAISKHLDTDLIYVHSTGQVDGKESYLNSLRAGKFVYESIELIDERHADGADFVVLCQTLSVTIRVGADPSPKPRAVTATALWRQTNGAWRLVAMQATPRASP
ncbi:MAG TPA: nuclear transport factor 2 family protein [Pseudolabrys sp.]